MHLQNMKASEINIPNPCSESWKEMEQRNNGRFCQSCSTVVHDLSKMSDTQIYYLLQQSDGKICGRMHKSQLNRTLIAPTAEKSPDLLAVVLGFSLLMSAYPAYSQEEKQVVPEISLIEQLNDDSTQIDLGHDYVQMQFVFVDEETSEPIPFLKVRVYGENGTFYAGANSDFDGMVKIQLSPDQFDGADSLLISSVYYGDVDLAWDRNWSKDKIQTIPLSPDEVFLQGDVIIVGTIVPVSKGDSGKVSRRYKRDMRKIKRKARREND